VAIPCSFCQKSAVEGRLSITSPQRLLPARSICEDCVSVCFAIMKAKPVKPDLVDSDVTCCFCSKHWDAIKTMMASPQGVVPMSYICDECVELCDFVLVEERSAQNLSVNPAQLHVSRPGGVRPGRSGPRLAKPLGIPFPWLRRISLHVWAHLAYAEAGLSLLRTPSGSAGRNGEKNSGPAFLRKLLQICTAVDRGEASPSVGRFRAWGYYHRAFHLSRVVASAKALGPLDVAILSPHDWTRILHFANLTVSYFETAAKRLVRNGGVRGDDSAVRRKLFFLCIDSRFMLGNLLIYAGVGDASQNLDEAFRHYRLAASTLSDEGTERASVYAAHVWTKLGSSQLAYPSENRAYYAKQAVRDLLRAKGVLTPFVATMQTPADIVGDSPKSDSRPARNRARRARSYSLRLGLSTSRTKRTGNVDPIASGVIIPPVLAKADWYLGTAYYRLGEPVKAAEHFRSALANVPPQNTLLRASIEADIGYAYLDTKSGDPAQSLSLATRSFVNSLTACMQDQCVKRGFAKIFILGLIGNARVYLESRSLNAIDPRRGPELLRSTIEKVRLAAKMAREAALYELLQEALFVLGKAYALQGDDAKSYSALALACRVSDRAQRLGRTPRLSRFLVGAAADLDDLLLLGAIRQRFDSGKERPRPLLASCRPSLWRLLCFAERLRTRFLQQEIAVASGSTPEGATASDLEQLFEWRRSWNESELTLLEYESAPFADDQLLGDLQKRRNTAEVRYRAELGRVRLAFGIPTFDPDRPVLPSNFMRWLPTLTVYLTRRNAAIVEYHLTSERLVIFVVLPNTIKCRVDAISMEELNAIRSRWADGREVLESSGDVAHWERGYLNQVLNRLQPLAVGPSEMIRDWERESGGHIERVIVIPHRFLHLIPLHAVPLRDGTRWGDTVPIQYAPSASVLWHLIRWTRKQSSTVQARRESHSVSVAYSTPGGASRLLFSRHEALEVAEAINSTVVVEGVDASPENVKKAMQNALYIHIACHGIQRPQRPLDSGLLLAPNQSDGNAEGPPVPALLTLGEIIRDVRLNGTQLVVLSACETGLVNVEDRHEECLGLPAGFLCAGARTVISTLWKVDDIATWLFMRTFAREFAGGSNSLAALRKAQSELRGLSREHVVREVMLAASAEADVAAREQMIALGWSFGGAATFPFASPYWWAGFVVNGLA